MENRKTTMCTVEHERTIEALELEALRTAIRDGRESGPVEPLDMEKIITEARATYPRRP